MTQPTQVWLYVCISILKTFSTNLHNILVPTWQWLKLTSYSYRTFWSVAGRVQMLTPSDRNKKMTLFVLQFSARVEWRKPPDNLLTIQKSSSRPHFINFIDIYPHNFWSNQSVNNNQPYVLAAALDLLAPKMSKITEAHNDEFKMALTINGLNLLIAALR